MSEQMEFDLGLPEEPEAAPVETLSPLATAFLVTVDLDGHVTVLNDITEPINVLRKASRTNIRAACQELLRFFDLEDYTSAVTANLGTVTTVHNHVEPDIAHSIRDRLHERGFLTGSPS